MARLRSRQRGETTLGGVLFMGAVIALVTLFLFTCSSNYRAREWGGKTTVNLPQDRKLMMITWKDNNLWYLHRAMTAEEGPESYTFQESSSLGVSEGVVFINETRGSR